jgi:uracil phosphoribosyltransferase
LVNTIKMGSVSRSIVTRGVHGRFRSSLSSSSSSSSFSFRKKRSITGKHPAKRVRFVSASDSAEDDVDSSNSSNNNNNNNTPNRKANQMLIYVPPHPLLKHWLAVARNKQSPSALFRSAMAEIGKILMYEMSRDWLETFEARVEGPLAICAVEVVDPTKPVMIVPILRAGLVLVEKANEVLPSTKTYHLGYVRDERTLEPRKYLDKLPKQGFTKEDKILISDPMLATGGTIVCAVEDCIKNGADVKNIRVMCCVASPPALTKLSEKFPGLVVYAAMIDEVLNEKGYIVPGLGDAGDRAFGTD